MEYLSLTKDNISDWLNELDVKIKLLYDKNNYSNNLSIEEWLLEYNGCIINAVIDDYKKDPNLINTIKNNTKMIEIENTPVISKNITTNTTFFKWFFGNKQIWGVLAVWTFIHIMIFTHFNEYFIEMTPIQTTFITSIIDIGLTLLVLTALIKWFKAKKNA